MLLVIDGDKVDMDLSADDRLRYLDIIFMSWNLLIDFQLPMVQPSSRYIIYNRFSIKYLDILH